MGHKCIPERELTDRNKEERDKLLVAFARSGTVITHRVQEVQTRDRAPQRQIVAVVKQKRDVRRLILVGCPLGAPPQHEGGGSGLGDYEQVLATLETRGWSDAEKRAIRAFIAAEDKAAVEEAKPSRRRGKHRRK